MKEIKIRIQKLRGQALVMKHEIEFIQKYYSARVNLKQEDSNYFGYGFACGELQDAKNSIQSLLINLAECINEHDRQEGNI